MDGYKKNSKNVLHIYVKIIWMLKTVDFRIIGGIITKPCHSQTIVSPRIA